MTTTVKDTPNITAHPLLTQVDSYIAKIKNNHESHKIKLEGLKQKLITENNQLLNAKKKIRKH